MEKKLYDAALDGNVNILHELLQEDKSILDRVSLNCTNNYTPLHIAATRGHDEFVKVILAQHPELSAELELRQKLSPLHLASARGHLKIVEALLNVNRDMCFVLDRNGRNPLHLAAVKGRVNVLQTLADVRLFAAKEKTKSGDTILHLCVKYNQLEALKKLVEILDDDEFLNQKDSDGLNILHLAVPSKQIQTIRYLTTTRIDINEKNPNGRTAMDLIPQNPSQMNQQIEEILRQVGALKAEETTESVNLSTNTQEVEVNQQSNFRWLEQKRKALILLASLFLTMTFQSGLNPPGAVWQDDLRTDPSGNPAQDPHTAGESVMAYHHAYYYKNFLLFNVTAFVSSLIIILMLISELPFKHGIFMWLLEGFLWLTATSISLTYVISVAFITPEMHKERIDNAVKIAVAGCCGMTTLVFLGKTIYSLHQWWNSGRRTRYLAIRRGSFVRHHGTQLRRASASSFV